MDGQGSQPAKCVVDRPPGQLKMGYKISSQAVPHIPSIHLLYDDAASAKTAKLNSFVSGVAVLTRQLPF